MIGLMAQPTEQAAVVTCSVAFMDANRCSDRKGYRLGAGLPPPPPSNILWARLNRIARHQHNDEQRSKADLGNTQPSPWRDGDDIVGGVRRSRRRAVPE